MNLQLLIVAAAAHEVRHWLFRLGGVGLVLVGIIDNSFIPLPGSLDVFTILLSGRDHKLWPYYAGMATIGSLIGAYMTYRIGQKGGEEMLEKRIGKDRAEKVYKKFETAGFTTLVVGVLLPRHSPFSPCYWRREHFSIRPRSSWEPSLLDVVSGLPSMRSWESFLVAPLSASFLSTTNRLCIRSLLSELLAGWWLFGTSNIESPRKNSRPHLHRKWRNPSA